MAGKYKRATDGSGASTGPNLIWRKWGNGWQLARQWSAPWVWPWPERTCKAILSSATMWTNYLLLLLLFLQKVPALTWCKMCSYGLHKSYQYALPPPTTSRARLIGPTGPVKRACPLELIGREAGFRKEFRMSCVLGTALRVTNRQKRSIWVSSGYCSNTENMLRYIWWFLYRYDQHGSIRGLQQPTMQQLEGGASKGRARLVPTSTHTACHGMAGIKNILSHFLSQDSCFELSDQRLFDLKKLQKLCVPPFFRFVSVATARTNLILGRANPWILRISSIAREHSQDIGIRIARCSNS